MTHLTHQLAGLVAAVWVLTIFPVQAGFFTAILAIVFVMAGTLTPDLDQPTANLWRKMIGARSLGKIFQSFSGGHRHLTHSLVGIAAIALLSRWFINNGITEQFQASAIMIWWGYLVGYVSHPIMDTLTDVGVPWFWPLHPHLKVPPGPEEMRVTTGSWVELALVRGGLVVVGFLLISSHWQVVLNFFK